MRPTASRRRCTACAAMCGRSGAMVIRLRSRRRPRPATSMGGEAAPARWYRRSAAEVLELVRSSAAGLTAEEARRRLAAHGANALIEARPRSRLALLAAQFTEVPILLLLG